MKTLKDKLTASVLQAKTATPQPAAAATRKALPRRAAKGVPKKPAAPRPAADKANAPLPASRAAAPDGFAHPDQVWPD